MDIKLFVATKAFVVFNKKVLLLRESSNYADSTNTGSYDVVGGRIEPGQRFDASLLREVKEETGLAVSVGKPFFVNEWRTIVRGEQWQIVGIFFECFADTENVQLSNDHDGALWINPEEYKNHSIIDNIKPIFEAYLHR